MSREKPEADPTRMADRASDSFVMVKDFNFNGSVIGFVVVGSVVGRVAAKSASKFKFNFELRSSICFPSVRRSLNVCHTFV
jgi:hypothetical protein